MSIHKEEYNRPEQQLRLEYIETLANIQFMYVRTFAIMVVLLISPKLISQQINIDSFYNQVSYINDLEAKRKKFYELRTEYRSNERLNRSDWKDAVIYLFEDDRFQGDIYQLIKGDLLAGALEHLDDHLAAAKENVATARLYMDSGLGHPGNVAIHYSFAGRDYLRSGQLDSAAYYLDKAQELNIEHDLKHWEVYINRANLYKELSNWEEVDRSYMAGYETLLERNQPKKIGYYLYQVCVYYYNSGSNPELLNFYMNKLDEYQAGKPLATASSHYPLLDFLYAPPIDTTIARLLTALNFNRARGNSQGTNILSRSLANAYSKKQDYRKSIEVIEAEIESKEDTISAYYGHLLYDDLQKYHNALGNDSEAYRALLISMKYRDAYINQRIKESTAAAQVKYETERTEKELVQKEAELSSANQRLMLFGLGGVGLLGVSGLLFRNSRFRKKVNKELEHKNAIISKSLREKDDLLREIHHRVKNNLQIISSLLSLQSRKSTDAEARAAIQEGRDRVRSMALIHQNLYIDKETVSVRVEEYIPKLVDELYRGLKPVDCALTIEVHVQPLRLDIDRIVPIGLIINELTTNALKYAYVGRAKGVLSVSANIDENRYLVKVEDDGVSFDQKENAKGSGLGSQLIKAFCEKLNADLVIESNSKTGTIVEISIPQHS